jgi:uncharacterized protein
MIGPVLVAFASGALFAVGLAVSGMTVPANIVGFLDLARWQPALIFVMVGAIAVYAVAFRLIVRRPAPLFGPRFELPTRRDLSADLVLGAAAFGIGWGLAGYCGGPAIASLATGHVDVLVFVAAMVAGMALARGVRGFGGSPSPGERAARPPA